MTRKAWLKAPGEEASKKRPGSVKATTLADIADRRKPRKPVQCRICLADEVMTWRDSGWRSSLRNGICKDRAACEKRQPPLIPVEELDA